MRVLSFDMGTRNLAFALVESPGYHILRMGVIDLGKDAARPATDQLVKLLTTTHAWMLEETHDLVVELQPRNGASKILSHVLQGVFGLADATKNVRREVRFMQAKNKFEFDAAVFTANIPTTYRERKECAMQIAESIIQQQPDMLDHYQSQGLKQRTDLADAVLQACRHLQERCPT